MRMNVVDAKGAHQELVVRGIEAPSDASGTIAETGKGQLVLEANAARSGYVFQNRSTVNVMYVNELGAAVTTGPGSFVIPPGGFFPPDGYPVTIQAISVLGTKGDSYTAREW